MPKSLPLPASGSPRYRGICNGVAFSCLGYSARGRYALIQFRCLEPRSFFFFACVSRPLFRPMAKAFGARARVRGGVRAGESSSSRATTGRRPARFSRSHNSNRNNKEAEPQAPKNTPAPFDHDLQRLAEILGSLHFLRDICGSNEGQKWRNEAQVLIDTEAPSGERHEQMIASLTRGYRAFQQSYRTCTPAADFAIRRYLAESAEIAREITARYAN